MAFPKHIYPFMVLRPFLDIDANFLHVPLNFLKKAVACIHVHHDNLNIALACLYCSFENNPEMQWYSASTWEHHSLKHLKENLPIHPDDANFSQQFACVPSDDAAPCTFKQNLPHEEEIRKWAKAAKQFFTEEHDPEISQTCLPYLTTEDLKLSSLKHQFLNVM